jgi:lipopolysaccharide transport system ATP-binding protein
MGKEIAIKISNLGKMYSIGKEKTGSLRESLSNMFKGSLKKKDEFWAVRDVSFEVLKGDVIGIVGKNGAGKSTLLKLLSQITVPTEGIIEINGRVASLLEVGTGFHPELTGRENIFLNGTILGMSRKEVKNKFDEIVEFSGVKKFLDTPVKHYSSGMYVRLAFSVAAHLEPEILIIDEVLSVGDAEFQKKCLGKMKDVSAQGRTVLFVSHNMNAVNTLCNKGILLENGQITAKGDAATIVDHYLSNGREVLTKQLWELDRPGDEIAKLNSCRLINENNKLIEYAEIHLKIGIEYIFEILEDGYSPIPNVHLNTERGEKAFISAESQEVNYFVKGVYKAVVWIPPNLLNDGVYTVDLGLASMAPYKLHFLVQHAIRFNVIENIENRPSGHNQKIQGVLRPLLKWSIDKT